MLAAIGLAPSANASGWSAGTAGRSLATCIRPARAGDDARAILRDLSGFDCATPQKQLGYGDYWVVSEPLGALPDDRLNIRTASQWQTRQTLYIAYADGRLLHISDDDVGLTKRIQLGAVTQYALPPGNAERLLWKVEGAMNMRGVVVAPRIATADESRIANLVMAMLYGAFGGLCIALLTYNSALWATLRYRFQLAYGAMVAALLAYAFTSSGAFAWMMPDIPNTFRLRLNYVLLTFAAASAIWFARTFFEDYVFGPRLRALIRVSITAMLLAGAAFFIGAPYAPRLFNVIYNWTFASLLIPLVATLFSAWYRRSNFLWLFGIAWAAPIIAGALRVLNNLGVVPWSFLIDNSTLITMSAEALLSSVAIAYRIRLLSRERDQAVAAETVARRLADLDPLTGLLNRRAFLGQAIGRPGPQTLLIFDLDHFKQVNETIGHDGGDEVLRIVARMLRSLIPTNALVARIGGEEFAVLTDAADALDVEMVLGRMRAMRMPYDLRVTSSIGLATGPLGTEVEWKAMYRAADQALFAAKSGGRDRARVAAQAA